MNLTSISYFDNNQSGYVKFVWSYIFIKFQNGEENLIITNELTSIIYYIQNDNNQSGYVKFVWSYIFVKFQKKI